MILDDGFDGRNGQLSDFGQLLGLNANLVIDNI